MAGVAGARDANFVTLTHWHRPDFGRPVVLRKDAYTVVGPVQSTGGEYLSTSAPSGATLDQDDAVEHRPRGRGPTLYGTEDALVVHYESFGWTSLIVDVP